MSLRNEHNHVTVQSLGQPLAQGRTAEIFAWGTNQVLKLYRAQFSMSDVDYEADRTRQVYATGQRVPVVGEVVEIEGRRGAVYERLDGPTLLSQLDTRPWQWVKIAHTMAHLHAGLHARSAPQLPAMQQRLQERIAKVTQLTANQRTAILQVLATLNAGDRLCHNDFHPANILMTAQGPVVIDWLDATCGNPLGDLARTSIIVRFAGLPPIGFQRTSQVLLRKLLNTVYLRRYFQLCPGGQYELQRWLIPVVAMRLLEVEPDEQARLLVYLEKLLLTDHD